MSSQVGLSQQQGRRTPLSLKGGKQAQQQQQQQNNKTSSNLSKIQEHKSEASTAVTTKNGNSSAAAKNTEINQSNLNHKEQHKKSAQQNGSGNGTLDDDVVIVEDKADVAGASNAVKNGGTANGHKNNKNEAAKSETHKDKNNKKETEASKEVKPKKQETTANKQAANTEQVNTEKVATAKDPSAAVVINDKKETPTVGKSPKVQKSATPTKANERGTATPPAKSPASKSSTPSKSPRVAAAKSADAPAEEMPPLLVLEHSPNKKTAELNPTATSTPGKVSMKRGGAKVENQKLSDNKKDSIGSGSGGASPIQSAIPRAYSQISGRRSIRPIEEFAYNTQFRESYRRINTELDVTGNTNTSMDVTVGSEIPNNSSFLSFSLFGGRGRKRERTPPPAITPAKSQSAVELTTNDITPPKRARLDVQGIFTAMSSPLTLLRTRFSKTTLESSTPAKEKAPTADDDVQNVSGVSIEEIVCNSQNATESANAEGEQNITVGKEAVPEEKNTPNKKTTPGKMKKPAEGGDIAEPSNDKANNSKDAAAMDVDSDMPAKETPIIAAVGDPKAKQRGCAVM